MTRPLLALDDHLAPLLAGLGPAAPFRLSLKEAVGLVAAENAAAPCALPSSAVALRSGFAVSALDCAGASPQSPVPLPGTPAQVSAGQHLPAGCDAILDPAALHVGRFGPEALEAVEPGAWVRLAGQDLAAGEPLLLAGQRITAEAVLAASIAGLEEIAVRSPRVRLDWNEGPERKWLVQRIEAVGARCVRNGAEADLLIHAAAEDAPPRLALAPGAAAWSERRDAVPGIALPARFDALLGAWCALALPILARLSGAALRSGPRPLSRKVASAVGWSEVVLLRMEGGEAHPLAVGDAPLGRIMQADAFALLDPGSEGAPAGASIPVILLDRPF